MTTALSERDTPLDAQIMESVLLGGDLSKLTPAQRLSYYRAVCDSLGLNPLTKPFEYIQLNGKLVLYAKRDCTDQLRTIHTVSVTIVRTERIDDLIIVTAEAKNTKGRVDSSTGAVSLAGLKGEHLANAIMKAETKAKRRVTLSICGLGMLDETEAEPLGTVDPPPAHVEPPEGFDEWLADLEAVALEGEDTLRAAWSASKSTFRRHLTATDLARWEAIKATSVAL